MAVNSSNSASNQAKKLDKYTYFTERRLLWNVEADKYEQTRRNNHVLPKTLFGNSRLDRIDGDWGIIVSKMSEAVAHRFAECLLFCGCVPENVKKIMCVTPAAIALDIDEDDLFGCGVSLIFDDADVFDHEPLVDPSLLTYDADDRKFFVRRNEVTWHGKIPPSFVEYEDSKAEHDCFSDEKSKLELSLRALGLYASSSLSTVTKLSYGLIEDAGVVDLPYFDRYRYFPCEFEYEADIEACRGKYEELFEPFRAVADIWKGIFAQYNVQIEVR